MGVFILASASFAPREYRTALGQQLTIVLYDRTRLILNSESGVRISRYWGRLRIELLAGEMQARLTPNPLRDLTVSVGFIAVKDQGTWFDLVRTPDSGAKVVVAAGAVSLNPFPGAEGEGFAIRAGWVGAIERRDDGRWYYWTRPLSGRQVGREFAWSQGRLEFDLSVALGEAAREFNRYNALKIRIADSEVAARTVGGVWMSHEPEHFVAALTRLYPDLEPSLEPWPDGTAALVVRKRLGRHPPAYGASRDPTRR
jgi:transmembrane sensor